MKIELHATQARGGISVTAWVEDDYRGESLFLGYTRREALRLARERVKEEGGLGIYRGTIA